MSQEQSASSHAKLVPPYHYVALPFLGITTLYFIAMAVQSFSVGSLMLALFAVGATIAGLFARVFALGVQDRVIRLEERLRLAEQLPDGLKERIPEVRTEHLIGLRFAPDEELEGLVRRILDGEFDDRKGVKTAIQNWRADHQRI